VTARQDYWVADPATGDHALVTGAAERDELVRQGWTEAEDPTGDAMVTIWHENAAEPGRVPASALHALWSHRGWVAGPPPGSTHPAEAQAAEAAQAAAEQDKTRKPAAAGGSKDKE
jgi:hypothetical protein